jgi:tetratricopeptide (TPR) repeat protein
VRTAAALLLLLLLPPPSSAQEAPESVRALLERARRLAGEQDARGAMAALKRALELAPNSEELLTAYAQVALGAGLPLPALRALTPLTRMCESVAQYHYLLGVALMQAGDLPAATESLERAQRLEPDRPLTLLALGLTLNARKLHRPARAHLSRSLELAPESLEAAAALAEAEAGLGELDAARALAERALARAPGHATGNLVMGMVLMQEERYAEARDALLLAAAAEPGSSRAHYQLSLAYARLGDEASAERHLQLYREALAQIEERVKQLRQQTELAPEGVR